MNKYGRSEIQRLGDGIDDYMNIFASR
jgi:hypothetical protein